MGFMFRLKFTSFLKTLINSLILTGSLLINPINAQVIPSLNLPTSPLIPDSKTQINSACIYLDGRCIFELATLDNDSLARISEIQKRLDKISSKYLKTEDNTLTIIQKNEGGLPNIYISFQEQNKIRLLTVTNPDAQLNGVTLEVRANELIETLTISLKQGKEERKKEFLFPQIALAMGILFGIFSLNLLIKKRIDYLIKAQQEFEPAILNKSDGEQIISNLLIQRKNWNFKEVQIRILQLLQTGLIGGGIIFILGLFPYTRMIQLLVIFVLQYPLRLGIVGVGTYVLIRLSYGLIAQFNSVLALNNLIAPEKDRRFQLRINTLSVVIRGIITATWITIGTLVGLAAISINITPILAGAGIIGLAISFASQNLIKDAINGFCIILEDQYAVGDVINVGNYGGLVEYINLRITQIRDSEGRLITIPNSEVRIVANLSSHWSRADLNIPISYHTNIDQALGIIKAVANNMNHDLEWKDKILEEPSVLGVDNFNEKGIIIKVLIKTEPLKQWEVAREFRKRIKIALEEANIPILPPQQEIWFHHN